MKIRTWILTIFSLTDNMIVIEQCSKNMIFESLNLNVKSHCEKHEFGDFLDLNSCNVLEVGD